MQTMHWIWRQGRPVLVHCIHVRLPGRVAMEDMRWIEVKRQQFKPHYIFSVDASSH